MPENLSSASSAVESDSSSRVPTTRVPAMPADQPRRCPGVTRRSFLADTGLGFTGLALGAMLARESRGQDIAPKPAKAKSVIWIFLCGGVSHVESFDPKPMLNKYAGKSIDAT